MMTYVELGPTYIYGSAVVPPTPDSTEIFKANMKLQGFYIIFLIESILLMIKLLIGLAQLARIGVGLIGNGRYWSV